MLFEEWEVPASCLNYRGRHCSREFRSPHRTTQIPLHNQPVLSWSYLIPTSFFKTSFLKTIDLCIFSCTEAVLPHRDFLWLQREGAMLGCCAWVSRCGGSSCWERGLWNTGSAVRAHGLSCFTARGIFLDQGSNPCLLHWQVDSYPCATRKVHLYVSLVCNACM